MSETATAEVPSNVIPITTPPPDPKRLPKLYAALAKAQATIENAGANATNPGFRRGNVEARYADLASVMTAIRKPLSDNGLALLHTVTVDRAFAWVAVTARLVHESGEYLEDEMVLPVLQKTPQGVGSSMTYGRRYTACALTGLAQEDDDGMGGPMTAGKAPPAPKGKKPEPPAPPATDLPEAVKDAVDQLLMRLNECETVVQVDSLANSNQDVAKGYPAIRDTVAKKFKARREELWTKEKKS